MTDALTRLESYLRMDPNNERLLAEVFEAALRLGRWDRAQEILHIASQHWGESRAWRLRRAHWSMARSQWTEAQTQLQGLLDDPRSIQAQEVAVLHHDLALCAWYQGQVSNGLAWLGPWRGAAPQFPWSTEVQSLLLHLLHQDQRLDEALSLATQWAQHGPWDPEVAGVASLVAFDQGDLPLAQGWSQFALANHAEQREAVLCQASLALSRQQGQRVQQLLGPFLQRYPQEGRAWSAWAFSDMLAGDVPQASRSFERALQNMTEHVGTWIGAGWAQLLQGHGDQALALFDQALALDRNFADSHGSRAAALARLGRREEAQQAMARALRLDRTCMSAHYAQAVLDGTADDPQTVLAMAQALLPSATRARPNRRVH